MFKKILLALALLPAISWGAAFQSKDYFQNNGGLLDRISPLLVPERNAVAIQNITLDDRGQLSKRGGYSILNTTGTLGGSSGSAVVGGTYHNAASGSNFFALVVGTNVYSTTNAYGGTYTNVTGSVTITASATNLAQSTHLKDSAIFCNESDQIFRLTSVGNAINPNTGTFSAAKTCATYGSYLVAANTTESSVAYPSRVRWSDINNPDLFPALNYYDVEPNDGDKIVAVITYEDSTYIFKKRSIYRMMITGLDGPDAFIIRPVSRNIGAWAKMSVQVIPNVGIAFLAQNTVYVLSNNYTEQYSSNGLTPIGDPIQRTFDNMSRAKWGFAVAGVFPKRYQYWVAISSTNSTNSAVCVYDYVQKAWTVYNGMDVNMLAQAEDSSGNNLLLSGDTLGNHYKQDTGVSDNPAAVATPIAASYTTADLTLGTPEITKNFKYLYLFSLVDTTTTITVSATYDYNTTAVTSTISLGYNGAVYNTAVYDAAIYPDARYKVSRIELNTSAKAVKLQFANSSANSVVGVIGWAIVYNLEDFRQ